MSTLCMVGIVLEGGMEGVWDGMCLGVRDGSEGVRV